MIPDKHNIQFETEELLEYYVTALEECNSIADIYELNWYVKDRATSMWRELFSDVIEAAKIMQDEKK